MSILGYLIYNFLLILIIYKSINLIFDKNIIFNKYIEIFSYFLYYVTTSIIYLIHGIPIIMLISNIIFIFLIQFNYKTKIKDKILITMYVYLVMFILDLFISLYLNKINVKILEKTTNLNNFSIISIIIGLCIILIILKSIINFKNMTLKVDMPKFFYLPLIIIPFMSLILILLTISIKEFYEASMVLILLILLILNISVFFLYNYIVDAILKRKEQNILKQKYISYINQFEMIKDNFQKLNMLKHDIKKHVMYVKELILNEKYEDGIDYLNNLINSEDNILKESKQIINTGNTCIDTIVNLKLNEALKNDIKISSYVAIPYDLNIFSIDIICLLGNLLDNAIEANLNLKENKYIYLKIKYYNNFLFINTKNKYEKIIKNKDGKFLSTKKLRKESEGVGIKIITEIVEKYNGSLKILDENNEFNISIVLNLINE